jgi:hypothetical protein
MTGVEPVIPLVKFSPFKIDVQRLKPLERRALASRTYLPLRHRFESKKALPYCSFAHSGSIQLSQINALHSASL